MDINDYKLGNNSETDFLCLSVKEENEASLWTILATYTYLQWGQNWLTPLTQEVSSRG